MTVLIGDAAAMNASAYENEEGSRPRLPGWRFAGTVEDRISGTTIARWEAQSGHVYLAVRGSHSSRDLMEDLRIFLGRDPVDRMAFLQNHIEKHCTSVLALGKLAVGGHSLGGLVALGAASRWNLPGLVQNAPGWVTSPPPPSSLSRMLEIRLGLDPVSGWGCSTPRTIVLQDPHVHWWNLKSLHSLFRLNKVIEEYGLRDLRVDDPELPLCKWGLSESREGLSGLPARAMRSWRHLREQKDLSGLYQALSKKTGGPA